jgi:hypothetical protein
MRSVNPAFIPRNHRVEQALGAAIEHGDFLPFVELLTVLSRRWPRLSDILRGLGLALCAQLRIRQSERHKPLPNVPLTQNREQEPRRFRLFGSIRNFVVNRLRLKSTRINVTIDELTNVLSMPE